MVPGLGDYLVGPYMVTVCTCMIALGPRTYRYQVEPVLPGTVCTGWVRYTRYRTSKKLIRTLTG